MVLEVRWTGSIRKYPLLAMALAQCYDIILDQPRNYTSEPSPSCFTLPERWDFSFYTTIS